MGAQRGGLESFIAAGGGAVGGGLTGGAAGAKVGGAIGGLTGGPPGAIAGAGIGAIAGGGLGALGGAFTGFGKLQESQEQRELTEEALRLQAEQLRQRLVLQLLAAARQKRLDDINIKRTFEADIASKRQTALGEALTASKLASQLRDRQFALADLNRSLGRI